MANEVPPRANPSMASRLRRFEAVCFDAADLAAGGPAYILKARAALPVNYIVVNEEVCPTTGRDHLQIYIELQGQKSFKQCINALLGSSIVQARPKSADADAYCRKTDSRKPGSLGPFSWGELSNAGERTDLAKCWDVAKTEGYHAALTAYPEVILRHRGNFKACIQDFKSGPDKNVFRDNVEVILLFGPGGVGKSYFVWKLTEFTKDEIHVMPNDLENRTPYEFEPALYIEEFNGNIGDPDNKIKVALLNQILDVWPYTIKGLYTNTRAAWRTVFISCNEHPKKWFSGLHNTQLWIPFYRRFTKILLWDFAKPRIGRSPDKMIEGEEELTVFFNDENKKYF